jgi:hypothetical protein
MDKKRIVIANAFSINMIKESGSLLFFAYLPTIDEVKFHIEESNNVHSIIGHQGTADILTVKLGMEIKYNRENYKKEKDDTILVCMVNKRLDEGQVLSKEELENINIKFWLVH